MCEVSEEDFVNKEAFDKVLRLLQIKDRMNESLRKKLTRRELKIKSIKQLVQHLKENNEIAAAEFVQVYLKKKKCFYI